MTRSGAEILSEQMMRFGIGSLSWFLFVLAFGGGTAVAQVKSLPDLAKLYEYARKAPLDVREISVVERDGVKIHQLSFSGNGRGRVPAQLVVPGTRGRFAAVVYAPCCDGNVQPFLGEAVELAKRGAVSLVIDLNADRRPDYKSKGPGPPRGAEGGVDERDNLIKMVIEFRRGVDLLLSRADVDPKRIGLVGHSIGGRVASIMSGVEKRLKAIVIIASQISTTEAWRSLDTPRIVKLRESLPKETFEQYLEAIAPVDAIHYVKHAAPAPLLLQFGSQDDAPNDRQARLFADVASEPKTFKLYNAGHHLNEEARKDRIEWLAAELKLRPSPNRQ
jgi:dienelactone hydrolase